jgi:hypothetical protein
VLRCWCWCCSGAAWCCLLLAAGPFILAPRPRPLVSPSFPPSPVSQLASCHNCDGADKPRDLVAIAHLHLLRVEPATVELLLIASLKSKPAGTALKHKESVRHRRYRRRTSWGRPPIRRSSTQRSAPAQSPYTPPPPPRRVLAHLGRSGQDSAKACNLQRLSQCGCISEPISGRLQRTACTFRPAPLPFICCKSPVTDPPGLGHWKAVSSLSIHPHPSHCHEPLCFSAVNE